MAPLLSRLGIGGGGGARQSPSGGTVGSNGSSGFVAIRYKI